MRIPPLRAAARFLAVGLLALAATTGPAHARRLPGYHPAPIHVAPTKYDESQFVEHRHYRNSAGQDVHSPAHTVSGKAPEGASAQCRDGSYSFSMHRRGTCSHHGGVASWL
ncbi:DUF3761 domain-containing protein [Derxia gummosa]|uniref:DUF3761 domain-containing protein n=1 Tax=Derxia gummosa DSM 723 TaxID=1121388 RepID=A0A8B6XBB5_9BURK|nr:DUF3761 domain-containing protein [Derxia gummosa]